MKMMWRPLAALAFVAASSAACASPHYPIREGDPAGPEPLTAPGPRYPIHEAPAAAMAAPSDPAPEPAAQAAAPPPPPNSSSLVERESLPPPTSASTPAGGAPAAAPAAPPSGDSAAPAAGDGFAPRAVTHDAPAPPPAPSPPPSGEMAYAAPQPHRSAERLSIAGDVVAASGIFEDYEVQKGDHVDALARAFNTSRSVLLDANDRLKAPYRLRPGEILRVPVAKAYVAERGDTLSGVARRFGVEADELAQLNHISARAPLREGEKIGLPSSMHDRGPLRSRATEAEYAEGGAAPGASAPGEAAQGAVPYGAYRAGRAQDEGGADQAPSGGYGHMTAMTPSQPPPQPLAGGQSSGYAALPPAHLTPQAAPALSDSQVAAATRGKFMWPVRGDVVSGFGPGGVGQRNDGIDIKAPQGTSVVASAAGKVVYAGDQVKGGFGKLVLIEHADGWFTAYAHLDSISVHMMDQVTQGQEVGQVGATGDATQPVLHFEIRYHPAPGAKTQPVDPVLALPAG